MKSSLNIAPMLLVSALLTTGGISFAAHHKKPQPLTNPIPEKIQKGDIVVGVIERFQLPETKDATKRPATTDAYTRIQYLIPVGDGSGRLSVSDLRGQLYLIDPEDGSVELYLNHNDHAIAFDTSSMPNESGFGGHTFHPEFGKRGSPGYGKFYTAFAATSGSGKATYHADDAGSHESVIVEWTAEDPQSNSFEGSYRELFRVGQFAGNHNIGTLAFNPTAAPGSDDYGNLYFCLGDAGAAFDPRDYGQSLQSPHGAILRIDPMERSGKRPYGIPADNPFVSTPGATPEIWAYGLRHPQHFSWDRSGRMLITDIGQDQVEEVNIGVAGANYGWRIREGTFATGSNIPGIDVGPVYAIPANPADNFVEPVAQYDHDEGRAIGSGLTYEGSLIEDLKGKYLFADIVRGRIFYVDAGILVPGQPATIKELRLVIEGKEQDLVDVAGYPNTYRRGLRADLRLGADDSGEIFLVTKGDGKVRQLVPHGQ